MPQRFYGWRMSNPDHRDRMYSAPGVALASLPAEVDLDSPSPGTPFDPAYDQGQLGQCGPCAASGGIAYNELKAKQANPTKPSTLFVYYATRLLMGTVASDSGVDNRTLLKALNKYGWCDEALWGPDITKFKQYPTQAAWDQAATRKIDGYVAVPQVLTQMKARLAGGDPIIFGFTVYASFETEAVAATGDVPMPGGSEQVLGGHDVLLTGYSDLTQRFRFRNSWGQWGRNGYGTIPYAYALSPNLAGDFWSVVGTPPPPPPPPPPSTVRIMIPQAGTYQLVT